ncbi:WecB/TagA/CpsF family glycosyltransferase [Pleomorphomonas oryzae]|uniref:WecB/TagA/CpsF family glycosyltransferase n=1 Tax=Pleomorphomonas oryzae TaxID=261934 RepID=UPI003CCBAB2F
MLAASDPTLLQIHEKALLVVPDGMPLVWIGRLMGYGKAIGRVTGADLVDALCSHSLYTGQSHYFYGGKPGVAAEMARRLVEKFPGLKIAGVFSPPMRALGRGQATSDEIYSEIENIRISRPDFVWVGISSPKQEIWMDLATPLLGNGVCIGVGAAFDFQSGSVARAPKWMRDNGLEWLHRLSSEPKRLWKRYLLLAPLFIIRVVPDILFNVIRRLRGSSEFR